MNQSLAVYFPFFWLLSFWAFGFAPWRLIQLTLVAWAARKLLLISFWTQKKIWNLLLSFHITLLKKITLVVFLIIQCDIQESLFLFFWRLFDYYVRGDINKFLLVMTGARERFKILIIIWLISLSFRAL